MSIEMHRPLKRTEHIFSIVGNGILRFSLVLLLFWFGLFKFTATEATGIRPLISSSPLMSWMYHFGSFQEVSNLIGIIEIACAVLIAIGWFSPLWSAIGSIGGVITFTLTLSFLWSTPGTFDKVPGFFLPVPSFLGSFLLKDLALLAASFATAAEALRAYRNRYYAVAGQHVVAARAASL
jgi:uncharacterized membrane protein YkgB